ncbi:hypothetical protein IQ264_19440 [Phormidium sp. LEGE 05292]|uniref:hypothetical protein n=1 Tax=[Phormidium] sp. LEGE 05292 TaxID=767427 RepID=UPI00187F7D0F|nr:hypothetical protein [Phormidium sp. LEGE 05292]MBE9227606.1 hypothetical protein [Phormidium sp. LEGE 05292]
MSIYYPHLFLFVYSLKQIQDDIKPTSQQQSWETLRYRLNLDQELDYDPERNYPFTVEDLEGVTGFYRRYTLGDTDSLLVCCATKDKENPQNYDYFYEFQKKLEAKGTIGKTWLILGYLNSATDLDKEKAAKQAYQSFRKNTSEPQLRPGNHFLGSTVFEVWESPENWTNTPEHENVLICICPHKKIVERIETFQYELMLLFYYRHKIYWNYRSSINIKKMLIQEGIFPTINQIDEVIVDLPEISSIEQKLDYFNHELCTNLRILAQYTKALESLKVQLQNLRQNLQNYQNHLAVIKDKATEESGLTKLKFLEEFGEFTAADYLWQMEQDYRILVPHLQIREKYINSIRTFVDLFKAEQDRQIEIQNTKFQDTVIFIGTSIGTSTFIAAASAPFIIKEITTSNLNQVPNLPPANNTCFTNIGFLILLYLAIGLISGYLVYKCWRFYRRSGGAGEQKGQGHKGTTL